ncbi:FKBP-type peptidyl-prolyl cis-trans isomerase [Thermomonospora catenispora]|uniref:FKBP-type peptidyl-prolyl cis-trans isomerase n=1 Tax=Thermomonospora catenispora TaxID=2493090 RepID=UPI001124CAE9|nr:FKBP-type peptidyl-prolyl cis-trans isomerase [Thermomonospora catenispora]TNY37454.1 FKBP-type peptidyl-prolyl cis-trans isomerase [Thermomonospora catenispora]
MRRRLLLPAAALAAASLLLSGCSLGRGMPVEVSGEYGGQPEVKFDSDAEPGDKLKIETLVDGEGAEVRKGDLVVASYVGYRWNGAGAKLVANSYTAGRPGAFPSGKLVPGLEKALVGAKVGSRVVALIPPDQGYGDRGDERHQIGPNDSLVYVLDVLATYGKDAAAKGAPQPLADARLPQVADAGAGRAPRVRVPRTAPPAKLQVRTLIQGTGPALRGNRLAVLHFTGVLWRTGKEFYSTWSEGRPAGEVIGVGQDIKAFDEGLVGQRIGSRVLLVVPPAWGYGSKGLPHYGIKGDDTLIYVVDILGAH